MMLLHALKEECGGRGRRADSHRTPPGCAVPCAAWDDCGHEDMVVSWRLGWPAQQLDFRFSLMV